MDIKSNDWHDGYKSYVNGRRYIVRPINSTKSEKDYMDGYRAAKENEYVEIAMAENDCINDYDERNK